MTNRRSMRRAVMIAVNAFSRRAGERGGMVRAVPELATDSGPVTWNDPIRTPLPFQEADPR